MSLDIAWGFLALVSSGIADYLARPVSGRIGSVRTVFYVQAIGIALPLAYLVLEATVLRASGPIDWQGVAISGLVVGIFWVLGYVSYYRGLHIGMVSIVSAVTSAWLLVTVLLAVLFFGEVITLRQAVLIGVITAGILLLARTNGWTRRGSPTGFWYGLGAMLTFGTALALWKPLGDAGGPMIAAMAPRIVASVLLGVTAKAMRVPLRWPAPGGRTLLVVMASLDSLAFVAYSVGLSRVSLAIMAPLWAAHPIVTMALAWSLLRERPTRLQALGIALTLAGVLTLSAIVAV